MLSKLSSRIIRKNLNSKKSTKSFQPIVEQPNDDLEYQKAIQESLKASNSRNQLHEANTQPEFKLRKSNEMVGLMNIGNTCYFNAMVQVLFQIKDFRERVLNANVEAASHITKYYYKI